MKRLFRDLFVLGLLLFSDSESVRSETLLDIGPIQDAMSTNNVNALQKPNAQQLAFQELELGLFIHFGMNTFSGEGTGGNGKSSPAIFNPTELDCHNWMKVAKAMGAKYVVLTVRHEEGFCLWPTETTDYSIKSSPYKNGKGDIVREFVDACREHDLKPCIYHPSYMDAHHIFKKEDPIQWYKQWFNSTRKRLSEPGAAEAFKNMQITQVRELLTRYGDITCMWFDHIGETQNILDKKAVNNFWTAIIHEARRLQPRCLLASADMFHTRTHAGKAPYPLWHAATRRDLLDQDGVPVQDSENGNQYMTWEANAMFSGGWFWNGDHVKPVNAMVEHYYITVGRGANFLPNFAPDKRGLMPDKVLDYATQFGDRTSRRFDKPVARTSGKGNLVELNFPEPHAIDHVITMEELREGQKIAAYVIEYRSNDQWKILVEGKSVGHKRIDRFPPVHADAIRFRCLERFAEPVVVRSLSAYDTQNENESSEY